MGSPENTIRRNTVTTSRIKRSQVGLICMHYSIRPTANGCTEAGHSTEYVCLCVCVLCVCACVRACVRTYVCDTVQMYVHMYTVHMCSMYVWMLSCSV